MKECIKCFETKSFNDFNKDKNKKDGYDSKCKCCRKLYRSKNKHKIDEYNKNWRSKNKEYICKYNKSRREETNEWFRNKRQTDELFKLKRIISNRIYKAINNRFKEKSNSLNYLGCDIIFYRDYISKLFVDGMSWDNHGEWHIDHIIPLASAETNEELISLFNYKNTQPLWAEDNIKKRDKVL